MIINVLIVEDDPMVAEINKRFMNKVEGYQLVGTASTGEEAMQLIEERAGVIDLILLDVYMSGQSGLELLSEIRRKGYSIDVILITAASDTEKINTALQYGAIDYLIKPFEFDRFKQALLRYQRNVELVKGHNCLSQVELDQRFFASSKEQTYNQKLLPKGLTKTTLVVVINSIKLLKSFTTDDVSAITGISRVSIRKYLIFLVELGVLEEALTYGIGRPGYRYTYIDNSEKVEAYLD